MYDLVIIEDEETMRQGLCYLFPWDSIGFQIAAEFGNAEEALQFLLHNRADAVLTDICLPKMDGVELTQRLRDEKMDTAVVFLTGYRDFKYAQQAVKCGARDFLLKPVKYNELVLAFLKIKEDLDASYGVTEDHPGPEAAGTHRRERLIEEVKKYLAANLRTATLEDAAVAVNLSGAYLSRLFREKTGVTFSEYLLRTRMEYAGGLLRGSDNKTYEVSDLVGYDSPRNFSRAFKKYYGMTPREYKEG